MHQLYLAKFVDVWFLYPAAEVRVGRVPCSSRTELSLLESPRLFIVPSVLVKGIGLKHGLVERSIAYFVLFIACAELALPDQSYLY